MISPIILFLVLVCSCLFASITTWITSFIYLSNNHIPLIPHYITKLSNSVEIFDISHNQIPVIDAQEILKWLGGRIKNIKLV